MFVIKSESNGSLPAIEAVGSSVETALVVYVALYNMALLPTPDESGTLSNCAGGVVYETLLTGVPDLDGLKEYMRDVHGIEVTTE